MNFLTMVSSLLTIKGAPDVLIGRCSYYVSEHGETIPLNAAMRATVEQLKNTYSSQGKRCLLLARKIIKSSDLPKNRETSEFEHAVTRESNTGLTFVGMVAIVDPLRHDIPHVVSTLRGAGIRIAMVSPLSLLTRTQADSQQVTGDFALTALAIAREAGIVTSQTVDDSTALQRYRPDDTKDSPISHLGAIVLSGSELMSLNEHQWETLTHYEEIVFARTTPEQKLRIVREFQKGNVVAMTGDGVNDAPSLRAADVGISMGSGSDIAMEAADMVLLDTFSSIIIAVQYGRVVFDNLKKVCLKKLYAKNHRLTLTLGHLLSLACWLFLRVLARHGLCRLWLTPSSVFIPDDHHLVSIPVTCSPTLTNLLLAASPTAPPPQCYRTKSPKPTSLPVPHATSRKIVSSTGSSSSKHTESTASSKQSHPSPWHSGISSVKAFPSASCGSASGSSLLVSIQTTTSPRPTRLRLSTLSTLL